MCWCRHWEMRLISMRSRVGDAEWETNIALQMPWIWVSPHCIVCLCSIMLLPTMSCPQRPRRSVNSERHSVLVLSSMGEVCLMCPREGVRSGCDAQWESCKVQGEAGHGGQTPDEGLWAELPVHQPPSTEHLPRTRERKNARTLQRTCLPILLTYTHLLQEEALRIQEKVHTILVS